MKKKQIKENNGRNNNDDITKSDCSCWFNIF